MAVSPRQIGFAGVADRTIQACLKQLNEFCEALRQAVNAIPIITSGGADFVPILNFGGTAIETAGGTYGASRFGKYRQVGNIVVGYLRMQITAKGANVGVATITGLLPAGGAVFGNMPAFVSTYSNMVAQPMSGNVNAATITLLKAALPTTAAMTDADFNNNSDLILFFMFFTA